MELPQNLTQPQVDPFVTTVEVNTDTSQLFADSPLPLARNLTTVCIELELELIQTQMTQKPMLWAEIRMRVRCANIASAECIKRGRA